MTVVRFFAAARAATGRDTLELADSPATIAELKTRLVEHCGDSLSRLVDHCSYLVDGQLAAGNDTAVAGTATVDVLPPFAGG